MSKNLPSGRCRSVAMTVAQHPGRADLLRCERRDRGACCSRANNIYPDGTMRETHIQPAPGIDAMAVVESACASAGLTITMRGTLAAYPGCVHWHLKRGRERGTLEITWWPKTAELWFKVAT